MDLNRIINMIVNQLLRRAVSGGVNAAMKQVSRLTGPASAADQEQAQAAALAEKRARQAAKIVRKL